MASQAEHEAIQRKHHEPGQHHRDMNGTEFHVAHDAHGQPQRLAHDQQGKRERHSISINVGHVRSVAVAA